MSFRDLLKQSWHFIWEDDSIWSWLANIVLAFFLIKFIVYPGLGYILGTSFPIVAVVSSSMEHTNTFQNWWNTTCCSDQKCFVQKTQQNIYQRWDITKEKYVTYPYTSGFNKGDIMILAGGDITIGDVIVFAAEHRSDPIIHRLVNVNTIAGKPFYNTQGDNNCGSIADFEKNIPQERIIGKAIMRIPLLGWLKIMFVEFLTMIKVI